MAQSTADLYDRALSLSANIEDNFLDLARSLRQLSDRDPELYRKVVEKSKLGIRKAYYLIDISRVFDPLQVSRPRLKRIGWTKLQILSAHVTKENVQELLVAAENNTAAQLKQLVRGEQPMTNAHCVLMYFTPAQYEALEAKLVKHGATRRAGRGMANKEQALLKALDAAVQE